MRSAAVSIAIMIGSIGVVASSSAAIQGTRPPAPGDSAGDTSGDSGLDTGDDTGIDTGGDSGIDTGPIDTGPIDTSTPVVDTADTDLPDVSAAQLAGEKGGFGCSSTATGTSAMLAWAGVFLLAGGARRKRELPSDA